MREINGVGPLDYVGVHVQQIENAFRGCQPHLNAGVDIPQVLDGLKHGEQEDEVAHELFRPDAATQQYLLAPNPQDDNGNRYPD